MKKKIGLTVLIFMVYIGVNMLLNIGSYSGNQEYAHIAAQQVNGDDVYSTLQTQSVVTEYMWLIKTGIILIGIYLSYLVWKPKNK